MYFFKKKNTMYYNWSIDNKFDEWLNTEITISKIFDILTNYRYYNTFFRNIINKISIIVSVSIIIQYK